MPPSSSQTIDIPFQLTFIGDGTQRAELEASARRLGLQDRVTFAGELRGSDLKQLFRRFKSW